MRNNLFLIVLNFVVTFKLFCSCEHEILKVVKNTHEDFIFLATIDGNIHLLNRHSGELKWSTKLFPFIKTTSTNGSMLIPNPVNGQLYIFHQSNDNKDVFSPLEYNLYEYVKKTPLFMENLLLTGSKSDQWLSIDIETGEVLHKYQTGNMENCPQHNQNVDVNQTMYIGICQYNLVVSDPNSRQIIYNVVLNSLATHAVTDLDQYNMRHYVSSDSGLVVTKYKTGDIESGWSLTLDSSVIGLYSITSHGILSRLQFTSMSHETISLLFASNRPWNQNKVSLKKAMFFGQSTNSWYILKTLIHEHKQVKSIVRQHIPLITGPMNGSSRYEYFSTNDDTSIQGFYQLPFEQFRTHQNTDVVIKYLLDFDRNYANSALIPKVLIDPNYSNIQLDYGQTNLYIQLISITVVATFIVVTYIACHMTKERSNSNKLLLSNGGRTYDHVDNKSSNDNDAILVGDLTYYPKEILGYGTNGTAVFRGIFHGNDRPVAVKRLLKSERSHYELQFLRQSFDCSHLIKCFYITQSREFTFLALELCECTLDDYVSDTVFRERCGLDKITTCRQITVGVHFLHDKGIVHRDLKPRNVLLMKQHKVSLRPDRNTNSDTYQYKIVISDFGLSRQSVDCRLSITKTGCGGTSGYMAPELSRDDVKRINISTDIFSCGILFYYIFTDGQHPFGDEILSRQHRIHQGQYHLSQSLIHDRLLLYFINSMLQSSPNDRPSAEEILQGPLFWKSIQKLSFLCDVSDIIETNELSLQTSLDKQSVHVFDDKWTDALDPELVDTLTSQRSYKIKNLSHLIRALRNKRNHFHELPSDLSKQLFDSNLSGLAIYIDTKFPNLYTALYGWVRSHLELFPNSIHQYFPSSVLSRSSDLCSSSDNLSDCVPDEPVKEADLLEWRKPKRKRPNQTKKCRGVKNDRKLII